MRPLVLYRALRFAFGTCVRRPSELQHVAPYLKSMVALAASRDGNVLGSDVPWVSFRMIRLLRSIVEEHMVVLEYGSGGSTLFFARRAKEVVSVEHDEKYFNYVQAQLRARKLTNCLHRLVPAEDCEHDTRYVSSRKSLRGKSLKGYVEAINVYPDDYFDLVFVDGRARSQCLRAASGKVKKTGYLILDNSSRMEYQGVVGELVDTGWRRQDVYGLTPFSLGWDQTSVFDH